MMQLPKHAILSILTFCATGPLATAAVIANYDFQQYATGSTGETNPTTASTDDRIYEPSPTLILPTGITSVSDITFSILSSESTQNQVNANGGSQRFRWRADGPGTQTASFSVVVTSGYAIENFSLSMLVNTNDAGSFEVSYNNGTTVSMGDGADADNTFNLVSNNSDNSYGTDSVTSQVTGTVDFLITYTPDNAPRTAFWDDFQLNGSLVEVVVVPEPSSALLFGLGALGLAARRRRVS